MSGWVARDDQLFTDVLPVSAAASDVDRERTVRILWSAAVRRLLTAEETAERVSAAYAARYRDELEALTYDLPAARTQGEESLGAVPGVTVNQLAVFVAHLAVICVLAVFLFRAWLRSTELVFWPVWPLALLGASVVLHARWLWRRATSRAIRARQSRVVDGVDHYSTPVVGQESHS